MWKIVCCWTNLVGPKPIGTVSELLEIGKNKENTWHCALLYASSKLWKAFFFSFFFSSIFNMCNISRRRENQNIFTFQFWSVLCSELVCGCQLLIGVLLSLWAIYLWVCVRVCVIVYLIFSIYDVNVYILTEKIIRCEAIPMDSIFYVDSFSILRNLVLISSQYVSYIPFVSFEIFNHLFNSNFKFQMTIIFLLDSNSKLHIFLFDFAEKHEFHIQITY